MNPPSKKWYTCNRCGKRLSSGHSLWRHKKKCQVNPIDIQDLPSMLPTRSVHQDKMRRNDHDDDSASVLSIGTLNRIVNKQNIPTVEDVEEVIRGDNRSKKKRTRSDDLSSLESPKRVRKQPDCVGYITPIKGSYDSDDESQVSPDDSDDENEINTKILPLTPNVIADLFPAKDDNGKKTILSNDDEESEDSEDEEESDVSQKKYIIPDILAKLAKDDAATDDIEDSGVQQRSSRVVYLPGTIEELREKLLLLLAEFEAGNTTTRNEIVAILDQLWDRNAIDEQSYIDFNNRIPIKGKGLKTNLIQDTVKYLVAHDKKELVKLLKDFKKTAAGQDDTAVGDTVANLEELVNTFLEVKDDAEADDELTLIKIGDVLRELETSKILKSNLHRLKMLLNYIDRNRYRVQSIVLRLSDAESERERVGILEQLTREGLLSQEQFEKLEDLKQVDLPRVIDIIKETKIGHGIKFLPSTLPDLKSRLHFLLTNDDSVDTELSRVKREIHALLEELLRREAISAEHYATIKEDNNILY